MSKNSIILYLLDKFLYLNALRERKDGKYLIITQKRLRNKMQSIFKKQINYIVKRIQGTTIFSENSVKKDIDSIVDNIPEVDSIDKAIKAYTTTVILKGASKIIKDFELDSKYGIMITKKNPNVLKYIKERSLLELSEMIKSFK